MAKLIFCMFPPMAERMFIWLNSGSWVLVKVARSASVSAVVGGVKPASISRFGSE